MFCQSYVNKRGIFYGLRSFRAVRFSSSKGNTAPSKPRVEPRKKSCWSCGENIPQACIVCPSNPCRKLQPVTSKTSYFDILSDHASYKLDEKELRRKYIEYQQQFHPDSLIKQRKELTEKELKFAEEFSQWLNKAYHTLKDPLQRAQYILEWLGSGIKEDDRLNGSAEDQEFLMEIMELREIIEDAKERRDVEPVCAKVEKMIQTEMARLVPVMGALCDQVEKDQAISNNKDFVEAKNIIVRLQYLKKVEDQCKKLECC